MTDNDRLNNLESGHVRLEKAISSLTSKQSDLFNQQIQLDKSFSTLIVKIDDRIEDDRQLEKTIRNLDDTINDMRLQQQAGPMERHREMQLIVDPMWHSIRSHDKKFTECANEIEIRLTRKAKAHVLVVWAFMAVIIGVVSFIYISDNTRQQKDIDKNERKILKYHSRNAP